MKYFAFIVAVVLFHSGQVLAAATTFDLTVNGKTCQESSLQSIKQENRGQTTVFLFVISETVVCPLFSYFPDQQSWREEGFNFTSQPPREAS